MSQDQANLAGTQPARGERALIRSIGRLLSDLDVSPPPAQDRTPFGDDMADVAPESDLLWTVDMLMDGVDFDSRTQAWHDIGRKAMAVNLSDCAAMACVPISALVAVALSNAMSAEDALVLTRGLADCGRRHNCRLVGGDTNSWMHPTVISVSVTARPGLAGGPVRRDGARPGDRIYLTGPVGGSILGRHLSPTPRIAEAIAIGRVFRPHALIDVSDGLALDLWRICEASGCGARLERDLLSHAIHPDARRLAQSTGKTPLNHALGDGEDFELIVVWPEGVAPADAERLGLLPLGAMIEPPCLELHDAGGVERIEPAGWEHFR